MRVILLLSFVGTLILTGCFQPLSTNSPQPSEKKHPRVEVPQYSREELIQRIQRVPGRSDNGEPAPCSPEARQARLQRMQALHSEMMDSTVPPARHALSTEYMNLQTLEMQCFHPPEPRG